MMSSMAVAFKTLAKEVSASGLGAAGYINRDDALASGTESSSEREVGQKRVRKEKKIRDPTEPTRPSPAYILFQADMRKQ